MIAFNVRRGLVRWSAFFPPLLLEAPIENQQDRCIALP